MKISMEERFRKKMIKVGKKNTFCRICVVPVMAVGLTGFRTAALVRGNGKRLVMLAVTFLLFVVYSSFSFPRFLSNSGSGYGLNPISEEARDIVIAEEPDIDLSRINNLIDEDAALEGKYYVGVREPGVGVDSVPASENRQGQNSSTLQRPGDITDISVEFSADDWRLILANQQHSLPDGYDVPLGNVYTLKGMLYCDARIVDDWLAMQKAAKKEGVSLVICSPYRDLQQQQKLFTRQIRYYMGEGASYMEAYQMTSQVVAVPNTSEHQMGLAFDIVTPSYTSLDEGFADTAAGKWLAENSCDYGFILRYPKGKEFITGIEYEPWHFRYVGVEAARLITEEGITLEEFWEEYM